MNESALLLQWLVFTGMLLLLTARGQLTLFHPSTIYLVFHAMVFVIRPTLIYAFDFDLVWNYIGFEPTPELLHRTLFLSSVALVLFCLSFTLACPYGGVNGSFRSTVPAVHEKRAFYVTCVIFVPLAILSILAADMQGERIGGIYIMTGTSGYLNDLQQVLIPLSILYVVVNHWRWYSFLPLLAFVFYRGMQGWGRWMIVLTLFGLLLIHAWERRRNIPGWKFVLLCPLIYILFANLGFNRMYLQNLVFGNQSPHIRLMDDSRTFREKFDTLDFANFDYLAFIVDTVPEKTETYTYGTQYLQIVTEPIPRKIWKDKPLGSPIQFFDLNNYGNFNGLTPSLIGDGWMSGGWLGVLATMILAGALLGAAYNWFARNQHDRLGVYVFLIGNAMVVQLFRDGGISIFKFLLFTLSPILVWRFLSRRMEQSVSAPAEQISDYELSRR